MSDARASAVPGRVNADDDRPDLPRLLGHLHSVAHFARVGKAQGDVACTQGGRRHALKMRVAVGHDRNSEAHQLMLRLDGQNARRAGAEAIDAAGLVQRVDGAPQTPRDRSTAGRN